MNSQSRQINAANGSNITGILPARKAHAIASLLVLVFLGELVVSVHRQSLSWDEGDHIYAG